MEDSVSDTCGNFREKHPDLLLPGGPLRIMNYARAGGRAMALDTLDPVLKFGIEHISGASYPTSLNPWSGKLVMLDEAHNFTTPCKRFEEALTALREALLTLSPASILVALTATADRALVDIVKGVRADRLNDEGFFSCYHKSGDRFAKTFTMDGVETLTEAGQVKACL